MTGFTDEQLAFRDAVRDFCLRECGAREQREAWVDPGEDDHSSALYGKLAELGWLGVAIPEEYGGSGGTYVEQTLLFEELYRGHVRHSLVLPIYAGTNEIQRDIISGSMGLR